MSRINPGELRERIVIETSSRTIDNRGQAVESWSQLGTTSALVRIESAAERIRNGRIADVQAVRMFIRYRPEIDARCRVRWRESVYLVDSVRELDGVRQWMELLCTREVS